MVIDTSALVAILLGEPDSPKYEEAIDKDPTLLISAASVLEVSIVLLSRFGETGERELDFLLHRAPFQVVDVTAEQVELARHAFRTYGRGRHAAGLNFGDCFSYALSKMSGQPLLFKGQDFAKTDIRSALP
jgi:ribonuclease VapC